MEKPTSKANVALFKALSDANKAEYQIGAQIGSIQADLAKKNTPNIINIPFLDIHSYSMFEFSIAKIPEKYVIKNPAIPRILIIINPPVGK